MVPRSLRDAFEGHETVTARYRGWDGLTNGPLLEVAEREFDVLVTLDQGIQSQQPTHRFDLAIVVLDVHPPDEVHLRAAVAQMLARVDELASGQVLRITGKSAS